MYIASLAAFLALGTPHIRDHASKRVPESYTALESLTKPVLTPEESCQSGPTFQTAQTVVASSANHCIAVAMLAFVTYAQSATSSIVVAAGGV